MTYEDAIAYWFGRINFEVRSAAPGDLKLERMRALLRLLGDPHERIRTIHVTGTKGKGSTSAMLASVLGQMGYRVGLFTSPHLVHVEERVQVNGIPISHDELAARMQEIAQAISVLDAGPFPPCTFFEMSTALGFLHFAYRRVDFAVVEVGLGGRFDSTNVLTPLVSVITSIGFDHMAQLGHTLNAIAGQKAGIIKSRVPVVSGVTQPEPDAVIESIARELNSPLIRTALDYPSEYMFNPEGINSSIRLTMDGTVRDYPLGLLGRHQASNAAVVLAVVQELRKLGITISESAVENGLKNVCWPARIERVSHQPVVILDSAHNVPSMEALVQTLHESVPVTGRKSIIFAVSNDKDYRGMFAVLVRHFDRFYLTRYGNNPRCVPPEKLLTELRDIAPDAEANIYPTSTDAWNAARAEASKNDLIAIAGSVFLAGEMRALVRGGN